MGWLVIILVVLLVAIALPLVMLYFRRKWLSSKGAVFDCALKMSNKTGHWSLGIALYNDEQLLWYRSFSLQLSPSRRFNRRMTHSVGLRNPTPEEDMTLFAASQIIRLKNFQTNRIDEIAISAEAVTGLLSWLEASPPQSEVSWTSFNRS